MVSGHSTQPRALDITLIENGLHLPFFSAGAKKYIVFPSPTRAPAVHPSETPNLHTPPRPCARHERGESRRRRKLCTSIPSARELASQPSSLCGPRLVGLWVRVVCVCVWVCACGQAPLGDVRNRMHAHAPMCVGERARMCVYARTPRSGDSLPTQPHHITRNTPLSPQLTHLRLHTCIPPAQPAFPIPRRATPYQSENKKNKTKIYLELHGDEGKAETDGNEEGHVDGEAGLVGDLEGNVLQSAKRV